jgi:hypothetical protein
MRKLEFILGAGLTACGTVEKAGSGPWLTEARGEDSGRAVPDDPEDTAAPLCGEGAGTLPAGLFSMQWDDGEGYTELDSMDWEAEGSELRAIEAYEAVRFDLEAPARVYGFTVEYGVLPEGADTPIVAGLYEDFGHNGFDFWSEEPLWEGSLCRGDISLDSKVTYVLDTPYEVSQPTPIYVAHRREGLGDAGWRFDISAAGDCGSFQTCHSALNFPGISRVGGTSFWNGYSFPLQYDYVVRLHLEYTDEIAPEDRLFQKVEDLSLGSRVSWGDFDGDGDPDLFTSGPALFRNEGGTLVNITEESGISAMGVGGSGGTWGDFDNDGCMDLFVFVESGTSSDSLLQGDCSGGFVDITAASGIVDEQAYNDCAGAGWTRSPTTAAAWLDLDGDGFLDLYLSNFNCWTDYSYFADTVWHNEGDGTFTEWTGAHGFYGEDSVKTASRGVSPVDLDQDGDIDLWVNNYVLLRNLHYDNLGGGELEEIGRASGLAGLPVEMSLGVFYYGHTIGTAWGDLDGDGDFDAIAANLAHPRFWNFSDKTQVLIQNAEGDFDDIQGDWAVPHGAAGLRYQETHSVPSLGDFDQDGALDLVITAVYEGRPTDFYWGNGDGTFELDVFSTGLDLTNGWGLATADVDGDGDLDLATSHGLYINTLDDDSSWLQLQPVGNVLSNRAGIGATVRAYSGDRVWLRHVSGGNGQGGQDQSMVHIGLGEIESIDRIEVDFIGSGTVLFEGPFSVNQRLWLLEDGSTSGAPVEP